MEFRVYYCSARELLCLTSNFSRPISLKSAQKYDLNFKHYNYTEVFSTNYRYLQVRGDYSQFSQPPKIPLLALMLVHMWYEESTPRNICNFAQMPPIWLDPPRDIQAIKLG